MVGPPEGDLITIPTTSRIVYTNRIVEKAEAYVTPYGVTQVFEAVHGISADRFLSIIH